jgi:hypothetical protein
VSIPDEFARCARSFAEVPSVGPKKISPAMPVALLPGYEAATRAPVLADVTAAATTRATHAMPQTNPNRRSSVRSGSGWSTARRVG